MMDTRQIYGRPPRDVVDYWLRFADFDSNIGLASVLAHSSTQNVRVEKNLCL